MRPRSIPTLLTLTCLAALGATPIEAASSDPNAPLARVPLRPAGDKPWEYGLRLAEVAIGGTTRPFLVDTGGGITILTPDLVPAAGCTPAGRLTGFRSSGGRLDVSRCPGATLSIGGRERRLEAAVFDLAEMGIPNLGGILSLATFEGEAFTIDLPVGELILESEASLAARVAGMRELRVRAGRQAGGAALDLFVAVGSPRGELWLELDSGNVGTVLLAPHALDQLGLELAADRPEAAEIVELDLPGLGPTPVRAIRSERIYDGLLNSQFFLDRAVTFDLRGGAPRVWVTAPATPRP